MSNETKPVADCTLDEKIKCYQLMQIEFAGVTLEKFLSDFNEKQCVMILRDESGEIVGFSTLMVISIPFEGKTVRFIFSGDTTVLHQYRDSFGFGIELSKFFTESIEKYPNDEIYYVLISKGWRTYRVLPFYFKEFFPCYFKESNAYEKSLIDLFGQKKYSDNYSKEEGLLKFNGDTQRLRVENSDAMVPPRNNRNVDFFFQKNPDYLSGTELVCLAKVSNENLTAVVKKLLANCNETK